MRRCEHHTSHRDFNSIKVQFEQWIGIRQVSSPSDFNSIKVQFELCEENKRRKAKGNFNSIKVQLEPAAASAIAPRRMTFQFHKGTIRTFRDWWSRTCFRHFNSIKVQLERKKP